MPRNLAPSCNETIALEGFSGGMVTPGYEQDDIAGRQNSIEDIPADEA